MGEADRRSGPRGPSGIPGTPGASGTPGVSGAPGASGTPLARKIGIKPGHQVRLTHAPARWDIPGLPDGCEVADGGPRGADVALAFYRSYAELVAEGPTLVRDLADHAMLWIAWPRRAAGHVSDITENSLRDLFLPLGVVDVKVATLGEDWSGLKFVRRRENRGK
ncbi:collagen-like protein [Streptomyces chartreusis]|uniref:collagen-like protein n=1 Tax=Streptomyces chartreusis TaxID=1969 RepID=UPI0033F418F8